MYKLICLILLLSLTVHLPAAGQTFRMEESQLPAGVSYRGLHVLNDSVAWLSGPKGSIYRSTNGGNMWLQVPPPPADSLDYRTLWAFDDSTAVVGSAGQPALIYRTEDAGASWLMTYQDSTGAAFFDAMIFGSDSIGIMMSDPVEGRFLLLATIYGGRSWRPIPADVIPEAAAGEAGFAASNSGMVALGDSILMFGTGGSKVRVIRLDNSRPNWYAIDVPMEADSEARGIYSMAVSTTGHVVAVGGDYTQPTEDTNNLLISKDGGLTWERHDGSGLRGYRSGVAYVPGTEATFVAVGTSGMDISRDGGLSWEPLSDKKLNAIRFAPSGKAGWAVGPEGLLLKLVIEN